MQIKYDKSKDEKLCNDEYKATKFFGNKTTTQELFDLITAIEAAENIKDIDLPQYRLHPLKGDKKGLYSLTLPHTKYRIEFIPLDQDFNTIECKTDLRTFYNLVKNIEIRKISEHYGQ